MFVFRRRTFFIYLVLILLVCALVLAGCRSSSPPLDEGNGGGDENGNGDEGEDDNGNGDGGGGGNGGGDEDENGEVDISRFYGTWGSSDLDPSIEFTVGELIEEVEDPFVDGTIDYYFKGEIKCSVLAGGEQIITEKPDWPDKKDQIDVKEYLDSNGKKTAFLYVSGGQDLQESGTVSWNAVFEGNSLVATVTIKNKDGEIVFSSIDELKTIKFTKVSSP